MSFSLQDNYILINDTYDKLLFESLFFETNEVYEHITIKDYISTYREKESKKDRILFLDTVKIIMYDIYRQISYLELHNLSFSHITIDDIVYVNGSFVIFNSENIKKIKNNVITINNVYNKDILSLPFILKENNDLPFQLHYKHFYQSIALVIIELLEYYDNDFFDDYNKNIKQINNGETKLYYSVDYIQEKILSLKIKHQVIYMLLFLYKNIDDSYFILF
jgi:hypothetical protein